MQQGGTSRRARGNDRGPLRLLHDSILHFSPAIGSAQCGASERPKRGSKMSIDAEALLAELNAVDEHERIEAKRGTSDEDGGCLDGSSTLGAEDSHAEEETLDAGEETLDAIEEVLDASDLPDDLPEEIAALVQDVHGRRLSQPKLREAIQRLCRWQPMSMRALASLLGKRKEYLSTHVTPMVEQGALERTRPETPRSPNQKSRASQNE